MPHNRSNTFSDDEIERAMATVARVIELYGDTYWPILERLESELEERRARSARLGKHLQRFHRSKQGIERKSGEQTYRHVRMILRSDDANI